MCVMVNNSLPFSDLALMGLANSSESSPISFAKPQSIKLLSAPESINASRLVAVWCNRVIFVSVHGTGLSIVA